MALPSSPAEPAPPVSAAEQVEHVSWGDAMRKVLREAPKRTVLVPSTSDMAIRSSYKDHIVVTINGVQSFVPVDQPTAVPENVADIIEDVLKGEAAARARVKELSDRSRGPVLFNMDGPSDG